MQHIEPPGDRALDRDQQDRAPSFDRLRSILRHDLPSSIVVFLVALPLSLGIAIASNAPGLAGLIAAIVGGIIVGALGGSPLQVSGPAAGLTVVVADLVSDFGWGVTCLITVAAGVLQVLLGLSRVARAALAISPVVVHAMLAGIGITIALQTSTRIAGWEVQKHGLAQPHRPTRADHRRASARSALGRPGDRHPDRLALGSGQNAPCSRAAGRHRGRDAHLGGLPVPCEANRSRRITTGRGATARHSPR
jgi:Sulfate permease family